MVETRAPIRQSSRLWSALATLPRLFLTRGYRETEAEFEIPLERGRRANFSKPPQRVMGAIERGRAESNNATNTTGESANVNNRFSRARTPSRKTVIDADNWEEIMRRLLARGGGSNVQNNFYSETSRVSKLPHPRECGRGPNKESSAYRLYDVYEAESSSYPKVRGRLQRADRAPLL